MDTATGGLNVTITSQVVVYATAERAKKLHLFLIYPFLLCGLEFRLKIQGIWGPLHRVRYYSVYSVVHSMKKTRGGRKIGIGIVRQVKLAGVQHLLKPLFWDKIRL